MRAPAPPAQSQSAKKGANVALTAGIVCIVLAVLGIGYFLYSYFFSDLFRCLSMDPIAALLSVSEYSCASATDG